jgi:hypothetical protein
MLTSLDFAVHEQGCAEAGGLDSSLWHSVVLCESATIVWSVTIHDIS